MSLFTSEYKRYYKWFGLCSFALGVIYFAGYSQSFPFLAIFQFVIAIAYPYAVVIVALVIPGRGGSFGAQADQFRTPADTVSEKRLSPRS